MSRLIDADKLYDYISDVFTEFGDVMSITDALEAVEIAPTVNAVELPCKVGDTVWIVERDECGNACQVSGYIFMGLCNDAVIVTVAIYGHNNDFDHMLQKHIDETAEEYETDLSVFPVDDMYLTREEAEAALDK